MGNAGLRPKCLESHSPRYRGTSDRETGWLLGVGCVCFVCLWKKYKYVLLLNSSSRSRGLEVEVVFLPMIVPLTKIRSRSRCWLHRIDRLILIDAALSLYAVWISKRKMVSFLLLA
jgi:hypothetical protein